MYRPWWDETLAGPSRKCTSNSESDGRFWIRKPAFTTRRSAKARHLLCRRGCLSRWCIVPKRLSQSSQRQTDGQTDIVYRYQCIGPANHRSRKTRRNQLLYNLYKLISKTHLRQWNGQQSFFYLPTLKMNSAFFGECTWFCTILLSGSCHARVKWWNAIEFANCDYWIVVM